MKVNTGATLERFPSGNYFSRLSFFEYAPRAPLPRTATLTRFFHSLPEGARLCLRAPGSVIAPKTRGPEVEAAHAETLTWTLDAAERLQPRAVLLPTPASLTPGRRNRDRLRALAKSLPRPEGRIYVWAPRGLWEEEDSASLAADLGLVRAFDPLHEALPAGPIAYAQLRTMGAQTSFSDATLSDAIETLSGPDVQTAFLSIESDRSVQQAQRAAALQEEIQEGL